MEMTSENRNPIVRLLLSSKFILALLSALTGIVSFFSGAVSAEAAALAVVVPIGMFIVAAGLEGLGGPNPNGSGGTAVLSPVLRLIQSPELWAAVFVVIADIVVMATGGGFDLNMLVTHVMVLVTVIITATGLKDAGRNFILNAPARSRGS